MFKIKTNPTFPATLTIVGQGLQQKLELVYRHRTKDERDALLARLRDNSTDFSKTLRAVVLDVLESWDADADVSEEGLELLDQYQPGAVIAIWQGYFEALTVSRKGN